MFCWVVRRRNRPDCAAHGVILPKLKEPRAIARAIFDSPLKLLRLAEDREQDLQYKLAWCAYDIWIPVFDFAVAINSRGWAVGLEFGDGCYCNRAFLWDGQSEPRYLARDASSSQASDNNNNGTIIGFVTWNSPVHEFVIWQGRD